MKRNPVADKDQKDLPGKEGLMNVEQAAEYLGMASQTVYRRVSEKTLPFYKIGRLVRFRQSELDQWLRTAQKGWKVN